jgi:prepilin-type N-terminal cleavage/methylation domain-containing protein
MVLNLKGGLRKMLGHLAKEQGFTLMELLIAVSIVAVLAGVGVPVYLGLQSHSKAAEATANLDGIGTSQEAYKLTNGEYVSCDVSPRLAPDVNHNQEPWQALTAGAGFDAIGFDTNKPVRFAYAVSADDAEPQLAYHAGAIGDTNGDGDAAAVPPTGYILYIATESRGPHIIDGADADDVASLAEIQAADAFNDATVVNENATKD